MPSIPVTLTDAGTNYSLASLIAADTPSLGTEFQEISLQSDPINSGGQIFIGDSGLTETRYGRVLKPGDDRRYGPAAYGNQFSTRGIYLRTDTSGSRLLVDLIVF